MSLPSAVPSATGMSLSELTQALSRVGARLSHDNGARVTDVAQDSRAIASGSVFVARAGAGTHGLDFAEQAVRAGAVAIVSGDAARASQFRVPVIGVNNERLALSLAAEAVHGYPSHALKLIGITGTNGKTTTAVLVEFALQRLGVKTARFGTLGFSFAGRVEESNLTTPEADYISRQLANVKREGGQFAVLEASSHALVQERLDALEFAVAAFTNLTQDHLDFHGDLKRYGAAKARLFTELTPKRSVIHVGSAFGRELAERVPGALLVGDHPSAQIKPLELVSDRHGIRGTVQLSNGIAELNSNLVGHHNIENLLVVLAIIEALGFDARKVAGEFTEAPSVAGRLERCDDKMDTFTVVVDYAHTPDALLRVLTTLRASTRGRLICVFGCGGDRDPGKRPIMGAIVGRAADYAIVSNDNPRSESGAAIAAAIELGFDANSAPHEVILDRASAIERAIDLASDDDCVLIAGKGHETYQLIGSERLDFDDRKVAKAALFRRREEQR